MFVAAAFALSLCSIGCGGPAFGPVTHTQNPLVAQYTVSLPAGSTAAVEFGPNTNYGFVTSAVSATAPTMNILVAGMKQNSTYHMRAIITHPDGTQEFDKDRIFNTGAAPADRIPIMTVTLPSGVTRSPGVELVCLNPPPNNPGNLLRVMALSPAGDLIWYYDFDPDLGTAQPIKLLPNGHLLMVLFGGTTGPGGMVREIDLSGQTIHEFTVDRLNQWLTAAGNTWNANAIHHDILELPNGHLLVLVNTHKKFTNLPGYRGVTTVLGDAIVDLDPNYNPVWAWSSFDHLDVNRHPMLFPDWTHANTIVYSPDDGNILLSMRNQSWIIKIDYANGRGTGNIVWRLGYEGDFTLLDSTSPTDWFFAQHFASFNTFNSSGDFRLAVFDNGNNRFPDLSGSICGSTVDTAQYNRLGIFGGHVSGCYSRPAIFGVNETARTAQLLSSHVVPYSYWGGVSLELPNGNMFVDITSTPDQADRSLDKPKRTLIHTVIEELAIVSLVVVIFCWRFPAAVIPFVTIPIALIFVFVPILGGIALAIGIIVDATVVVIGEGNNKLEHDHADGYPRHFRRAVISAAKRINRPSFFVLLMIAISFLPMLTPLDKPNARVMEVTQQQRPRIVWELDVNGQESYRTVHLSSLYPHVQW